MPAKRVIVLGRLAPTSNDVQAVMWADVPAANQIAYSNPTATSLNLNASPAEIQAIRSGLVTERLIVWNWDGSSAPLAAMQSALAAAWIAFQAEVTGNIQFNQFGMVFDNTASWGAAAGPPMAATREVLEGLPCFVLLTPLSAFAANKFHFVLFNNAPVATSQNLVVKIRLLIVQPSITVVTGAQTGIWSLQRRDQPTTAPSGAGVLTPSMMDPAVNILPGIGAWNAPGTAPAGGAVSIFNQFTPQADEQPLTTLNASSMAGLVSWGGQVIYNASDIPNGRPLTLRANQTLEVVQDATAGTGNCKILCVFTVG